MNILEYVTIKGLWGDTNLEFKVDEQYNFLIGANGTGKTTVINLISSALMGNVEALRVVKFDSIELRLMSRENRRKPSLLIKKEPTLESPYFALTCELKRMASAKPEIYPLEMLSEEHFFLRLRGTEKTRIKDVLQELIDVSWISVHRHEESEFYNEEESMLSPVDQKLRDMSIKLGRYFSTLSKKYMIQASEFQKNSFLSLLTSEKETQIINFSSKIDILDEKKALSKVFDILGLEKKLYEKKLTTHLEKFSSAVKSFENKRSTNKGMTTLEFAAMYNAWKAHSLIQLYEVLQDERKGIYELPNKFIHVINELFSGKKTMSISEGDELVFKSSTGKVIPMEELSSGEKQLLIIVGEAVLQEQKPVIYIADEPELSLHISWQEQLTKAITTLNPNAQIIFATHSPDIVSVHNDKVIDMELVSQ